jgi:hypothetical protein
MLLIMVVHLISMIWLIVIITFWILLSPRLDHGLFGELSSQRFIG